jgi:GntR family transcriptional regulator, rspAB operon transcriptional repressor
MPFPWKYMRSTSPTSLIAFDPPTATAPHSMGSLYTVLRLDIVRLVLKPGQQLSENEIALRFGTSRAPVREAFIRLAEEGLIEVRPQRGSFVTRISIAAMQRARFVREAVEVSVVRRAAEVGLSARMIETVEKTIFDQEAAADASSFTVADDGFHRALVDAIGIRQLWAVLEREKVQFDRVRFLSIGAATPVDVLVRQHRAILNAIRRQDPAAAEAAMHEHMAEVLTATRTLLALHPDLIVE